MGKKWTKQIRLKNVKAKALYCSDAVSQIQHYKHSLVFNIVYIPNSSYCIVDIRTYALMYIFYCSMKTKIKVGFPAAPCSFMQNQWGPMRKVSGENLLDFLGYILG